MLRAAEVDLAVTYSFDGDVASADEGFDAVQLASDPFLIALPASHPLAGRRSLKLSELKNERWLGSPATGAAARYREFVVRVCRQAGFEPRIAFEPGDLWTGRGIVAAGLAVGLMPRLAFSIPHPGVVTKPLSDVTLARRILAVRVGDRRVAGVPPMLECLREAFGAWRAPG